MRIRKLFVRILIATILGLCTGIVMEYITLWEGFPIFLISGALVGVFSGIVVVVLSHGHSVTREDLRKMESPVLRILVVTAVGLFAGSVLEYVAVWAVFPIFLISGAIVGVTVGIIIEVIRYNRLMRRSFLEGKGLGLERLPAGSAEFINKVIKKMRYRKKVRSEVMAELAAHFEDELKDCKTEQEKQQKAEQLITQFGDVKLLAVLLRRAKKRCRPLWRTVVARTFQTIGLLILCFIVYVVWFFSGKSSISVDYLAQLNQKGQPPIQNEDNAWPHYEKAIALFVEPSQSIKEVVAFSGTWWTPTYRSFSELSKENQREIKKWVEQNEAAWREFVAGSEKSYCYCQRERKDHDQLLWEVISPSLDGLKSLTKLGIWRSRISVANGEVNKALSECVTITRVGKHWQNKKGIVAEQRRGLFLAVRACDEILFIIAAQDVSASDLVKTQEQLEDVYGAGFPLLDIEQERPYFLDTVQQFFTQGGPGGGHVLLGKVRNLLFELVDDMTEKAQSIAGGQWPAEVVFTAFCLVHAGRDETVAKFDEIYHEMNGLVKMTPYERHVKGIEVEGEEIYYQLIKQKRFFLMGWIMPTLVLHFSDWVYCDKSQYEALLTILALQRWRLDKGAYPDGLEELVKGSYLKQLPTDPYSDKPLVYKKTDDDFALYSVGENFRDDAGEVVRYSRTGEIAKWGFQKFGDAVFWPVQKPQTNQ
ncbi:MAG: hypothetical protein ACETWQ_17875 [Phycisphaerae bacterium]